MTRKREQTYRDALAEIEEIISKIENESIDVDLLAEKVRRAAELIRFCKEKLTKTEREVSKVIEEFEEDTAGTSEEEVAAAEQEDEKGTDDLF